MLPWPDGKPPRTLFTTLQQTYNNCRVSFYYEWDMKINSRVNDEKKCIYFCKDGIPQTGGPEKAFTTHELEALEIRPPKSNGPRFPKKQPPKFNFNTNPNGRDHLWPTEIPSKRTSSEAQWATRMNIYSIDWRKFFSCPKNPLISFFPNRLYNDNRKISP